MVFLMPLYAELNSGEILGIGFANAKTFVRRLNNYGITREEFNLAMQKLDNLDNLTKENN